MQANIYIEMLSFSVMKAHQKQEASLSSLWCVACGMFFLSQYLSKLPTKKVLQYAEILIKLLSVSFDSFDCPIGEW